MHDIRHKLADAAVAAAVFFQWYSPGLRVFRKPCMHAVHLGESWRSGAGLPLALLDESNNIGSY